MNYNIVKSLIDHHNNNSNKGKPKKTLDDIKLLLKNNEEVRKEVQQKIKEVQQKKEEIDTLMNNIICVCNFCPYEGLYRCEACSSSFYEGFNIKNYPC